MDTRRLLRFSTILTLFVLLAIGLVACQLPASEGPETPEATYPVPGETQEESGGLDINQINTQTAMAQMMETSVVATETQPPLVVTETPVPEEPAQPVEPTQSPVEVVPTPGIPATYSLQKGEFPFCIARRFNVNQYEVLNINGLTLYSKPPVGFTLQIPQTGNQFSGERSLQSHPDNYTVQAGDTLYTIACKYGSVSPDMIALANDISVSDSLSPGSTLSIP
jgi:LysM repeat protein